MARYRILSWGEIPAQIKVFREEGPDISAPLADWFMQEIDRVAMRDGVIESDEYLERWNWSDDLDRAGSPEDVAAAVVAELEARWLPPGGGAADASQ